MRRSLPVMVAFLVAMVSLTCQGAQIRVSPMGHEILIRPGKSRTRLMTLANQGDEGVYVQIHLVDWIKDEDGIFLKGANHPRSNLKWIAVEPSEFYLAPGEEGKLRVTADMPDNVEYTGSHWSMMVIEFFKGGTKPFGRLALGLYTMVEPLVKEADILGMEVSEAEGSLHVETILENRGNMHLRCTGKGVIMDPSGQEIASFPLSNLLILPGSKGKVIGHLPIDMSPGTYTILTTFDYGGATYMVGEKRIQVP